MESVTLDVMQKKHNPEGGGLGGGRADGGRGGGASQDGVSM